MRLGGCHCGAIRYQAGEARFHETICHCDDCRRVVGAASVAWFSVAWADFAWLAGTPASYQSSPGVIRRFCGRCGTSLTFEDSKHADELDLATATLDDPNAAPPRDHVFLSQAPEWDIPGDSLPRFPRSRTG